MKKQSLTLDEILQPGRFETDKQNYNLNEIPFDEWLDYENLHLYIPTECPKHSVVDACLWLENYYGFKEKKFEAYITSDHHGSDWHHDPSKPSGFYFAAGDTSEEDNLAKEIYDRWTKEGKADRPGFERTDAMTKASQILFEIEFKQAAEETL